MGDDLRREADARRLFWGVSLFLIGMLTAWGLAPAVSGRLDPPGGVNAAPIVFAFAGGFAVGYGVSLIIAYAARRR